MIFHEMLTGSRLEQQTRTTDNREFIIMDAAGRAGETMDGANRGEAQDTIDEARHKPMDEARHKRPRLKMMRLKKRACNHTHSLPQWNESITLKLTDLSWLTWADWLDWAGRISQPESPESSESTASSESSESSESTSDPSCSAPFPFESHSSITESLNLSTRKFETLSSSKFESSNI